MREPLIQSDPVWFFCEILNQQVVEDDGRTLGRVVDLTADVREHEPPITGLIIAGLHKSRQFLQWTWVEDLRPGAVKVRPGARQALSTVERPPGEIFLRKGLLDKQIVDMAGAKVVRVNDLQLCRRNGTLVLSRVDVGLRGLLRRVGIQRLIAAVLKWLFAYSMADTLINWRLVQPVGSADILRLKFSQTGLARLHPADLADIIEDLDGPERARVFRALDIDMAADVLEESDPRVQVQLIQDLPAGKASDLLEKMSPSKATDLLQDLEEPHAQTILEEMEPDAAEDVRSLLSHDEETAGGIMTTSFFSQPPYATVEQTLKTLRWEAETSEVIYYTYVENHEGHLLGVLTIRELLRSDPKASLESIMVTRVVSITVDAPKSDVVDLFVKYGLRALPVVDEEGCIRGVIRFKVLLEVVAPGLRR